MNGDTKGTRKTNSANSQVNAISFFVEQTVRNMINTAEIVSVNSADQNSHGGPAGYAAATPLVCQTDGYNNILPTATLHRLPFLRPQAGKAAIIMDPQPGDKAVAVFAKRDSSGVATNTKEPVQPGSFRVFDQADGFLINGFLGDTPEIWLLLDPVSGNIELSTKAANVEISCREGGNIVIKTGSGNVTIEATQGVNITAPQVNVSGNMNVAGTLTADGVNMNNHTHGGVQNGSGSTGQPNK